MSWLDNDGNMPENILFSKFTYIRNLSDMPVQSMSPEQLNSFLTDAEELLKKNGFSMQSLDKSTNPLAGSLCEKQYIEADMYSPAVSVSYTRAVFFNEPCNLCISVGGANLICISSILSGASVRDAYKISSSAEELMDLKFDFAYSHSTGYLSPVASDCGSGARISCAMYLPILSASGKISSVTAHLSKHGVALYPLFSKKYSGDIYMMTFSPPRQMPEDDAVELFEGLMSYTVDAEASEHEAIGDDMLFKTAEDASRAQGILSFCLSLSEEELISLTSHLRLAVSLKCCDMLSKVVTTHDINKMLFDNLSCSVAAQSSSPITSCAELDRARAMNVRKMISALPERTALVNT